MTAPPGYAVLPFLAMLLCIALGPLVAPRLWHQDRFKLLVSLTLGLPVLVVYLGRRPEALVTTGEEYVSFIVLLGSLYAISGGILVRGDLEATPLTNTAFLAAGSMLASLIGTTGASALLIRPLLQTNQERSRVTHTVVFFIFLVSNIGGLLTPLGDPPLFLGYLLGVPFSWTLVQLGVPWLCMVAVLLLVYFAWDSIQYPRESLASLRRDRTQIRPLRVRGSVNLFWLGGVVASVMFLAAPWREVVIIALGALSLWLTPTAIHRANGFTAGPMVEVAVLFFGIFLTMIPALDLLRLRGAGLPLREPWHFFWATGVLSSFLDNAPTYLAFLALGQALQVPEEVVGVSHEILRAISLGAVCMGANSYIGNAPNFMVKAIAEESGVAMPTFFGYVGYSAVVLVPLFTAMTALFL